jgi:hypothetical protein
VLFFGNSYTYVNDLPSVLEHLAASAGKRIETGQRTPGGETLAGHAATGDARKLLRTKTWNVVVLQDQVKRPRWSPAGTPRCTPPRRRLPARPVLCTR